ncbi:MCP four helix bundle domain-containing protein [Methylophaga sp.]|uniref:MCP four helix bundle domain-containing protein n=1 Tax=Methylophaga sp. TaxID=2024840 RepID=UPI00271E913E|nr:MCP four helix bundle domain-containing protein [Methylophaga sp.]MDO8828224.1 MCP four helix bundle domain-containing protein [Methylophaga sp.]
MEEKTERRLYIYLPWVLTLVVLVAATLYGYYGERYNPFETKFIKLDLLSTMRSHLLEAIEAEKNAVLAITDEASEAFAAQARQAADGVESSRKEIEAIILQEKLPGETEMINEFTVCWAHYRKLDETILDLAIQNTNLKAQKISATQCAQEMEYFEASLNRLIHRNTHGSQCNEAVMLTYEALTAGLNIFALHKPHIEEADDQDMDKIEQSIKSYDESVKKALISLRGIADLKNNDDLKNAETAYERFMNLTGEVLKLSRMNTNIKSADLSLGKLRLISSQCQEILTNLQETVQAQGNYSLPRLKKKGGIE